MEEKKPIKVKVITILFVIALIVIGIMSYFTFKFYNEKEFESEKVEELNAEVSELKSNLNDVQEKIDTISNVVSNNEKKKKEKNSANTEKDSTNTEKESNNSEKTTDKKVETDESFSDKEVMKSVEDYMNLMSSTNVAGLLEYIGFKDYKMEYLKDKVKTDIKYEDYKSRMLKYMSEELFSKFEKENDIYSESDDGYVYTYEGGGSTYEYKISEVKKNNDGTYIAIGKKSIDGEDDETKEKVTIDVKIKNSNGKCVIDFAKEK